jgi:hypothetical protein
MARQQVTRQRLKIVGVQVRPPSAATGVEGWMGLIVEVENTGATPVYVWASHRGYDYEPTSKTLTIYMAERPLVIPSCMILISEHPRPPSQVQVDSKGRAKIRLRFPPVVRQPAPDGRGWVERPFGEIANVDIQVQYADKPFDQPTAQERAQEYRARLQAQGHVVHAHLAPGNQK